MIKLVLACLLCFLPGYAKEYTFSVCSIFQNEAPYLDEWIRYHWHVGVQHFWLYNNESTDDYMLSLKPWLDTGIVELVDWPDHWPDTHFGYGCQPKAYMHCIETCRDKTEWLAIIDLDEYILPMKERDVKKTLSKHYSHASAIYINWLNFGTGGVHIGPGNILRKLTRCASKSNWWNRLGKSIIKPDVVAGMADPHFCQIHPPFRYFNGDGEMVLDHEYHEKYLRLNHYTFRDEWYLWNVKMPRYLKWDAKEQDLLDKNQLFSQEEDTLLIEFLDRSSYVDQVAN